MSAPNSASWHLSQGWFSRSLTSAQCHHFRVVSSAVVSHIRLQGIEKPREALSHDIPLPGNDKVIFVTHPADSLDDLRLIVLYDFNSLELLSSNTQSRWQSASPHIALTMPNEKQKFAM